MIKTSKIIPLVDENKSKLLGINITVYDSKLKKRIRVETYNNEMMFNLQDVVILCGLPSINIKNYIESGIDTWLNNNTKKRKKTPIKKLITKKTLIDYLIERKFIKFIDFINRVEFFYTIYLKILSKQITKKQAKQEYNIFFKDYFANKRKQKRQIKKYFLEYRKTHKEQIKLNNKKFREQNPEKVKNYCKKYQKTHKEHIRKYNQKYRKTHQEQEKKYWKKYRENHKEQRSKYAKIWYQKNKEQIKQKNQKYYQENKHIYINEKRKEEKRLWYQKNKEQIREYHKKYYIKNRERIRKQQEKYRYNKRMEEANEINSNNC